MVRTGALLEELIMLCRLPRKVHTLIGAALLLVTIGGVSGCTGDSAAPPVAEQAPGAAAAEPTTASPSETIPALVEEGFLGQYNIIEHEGRYYALAQDEGAFDPVRFENKEYRRAFVGPTIEDVKRQAEADKPQVEPVLIEEGFERRFNIIQYDDTFYALPQGQGAFDINKVKQKAYREIFAGATIDDVKAQVTKAAKSAAAK